MRGRWLELKRFIETRKISSAPVKIPNGQHVRRSVRQIDLVEPDYSRIEGLNADSVPKSGRAGEVARTLTDLSLDGQPFSVFQSPEHNRPCHSEVQVETVNIFGNTNTVTVNPVSQANGTQVADTTNEPVLPQLAKEKMTKMIS